METNTNDAAAAAAAAASTATATNDGAQAGAFAAVAASETPATPLPLHERIPEKYRVAKEDSTFDLEASTAKLLEGHAALEKRLGTGDAPPKTPEEYSPKTERFDMEALKADPEYAGWLKGAHAKGMTNDQVAYVLDSFADRQDAVNAAAQLGMDEPAFRAAVEPHFVELGGYDTGMKLGLKAVRAVIPDITAEEIASLPNHPIMARVLAAYGKEVGEDTPVRMDVGAVGDWESEVAKIKASEAYNKANHPEHQKALDEMSALYAKRYGTKKQSLGATATTKT